MRPQKDLNKMDVMQTITKPWQEPVDYLTLAFWFMLFCVVAFVMYDSTRLLISWAKGQ